MNIIISLANIKVSAWCWTTAVACCSQCWVSQYSTTHTGARIPYIYVSTGTMDGCLKVTGESSIVQCLAWLPCMVTCIHVRAIHSSELALTYLSYHASDAYLIVERCIDVSRSAWLPWWFQGLVLNCYLIPTSSKHASKGWLLLKLPSSGNFMYILATPDCRSLHNLGTFTVYVFAFDFLWPSWPGCLSSHWGWFGIGCRNAYLYRVLPREVIRFQLR